MSASSSGETPTHRIQTVVIWLFITVLTAAHAAASVDESVNTSANNSADNSVSEPGTAFSLLIPNEQIADPYPFFGLAAFYNEVRFDLVSEGDARSAAPDDEPRVLGDEWLVASGRYKAHAIRATGLSYRINEHGLWVKPPATATGNDAVSVTTTKAELGALAPELAQLRYLHLWNWLGALAVVVETSLNFIHSHISESWGVAVLVLAFVLKVLLFPVSLLTAKLQRRVAAVQAQLLPALADIKANFDGEEAHKRIMAAHSKLGVSPFYTLKPMLGTLIQVPVLIAVFNALGEMPALQGASFGWVKDLAYPDVIAQFGFSVPLLGDKLSLLPLLMTAVTLLATLTLTRLLASDAQLRAEKQRLMVMSAGFLLLFYPFPAAMVLYWTMTNFLQLPLQKLLKA